MADELTRKISELERLSNTLTPASLIEVAYKDDMLEEPLTRAVTTEQVGLGVLNEVEYATELDTEAKTIFGAINELKALIDEIKGGTSEDEV